MNSRIDETMTAKDGNLMSLRRTFFMFLSCIILFGQGYRLTGFPFYFYLLLLQLVLCRVAALKSLPIHWCRLYFPFGPLTSAMVRILRNQKFIMGLDIFSNQRLTYLAPFG